ncbi:MAG: cytochrome c [Microvirga sp.]|jgi:hypothetical protein|nr:cytochrome c [Microvirga sp.]
MNWADKKATTTAPALPIQLRTRSLKSRCRLAPYKIGEALRLSCVALRLQVCRLSKLQPVVVLAGIVLALPASPSQAQEMGSRSQGLALAREICAPCHAILKGGDPSPDPSAPSFEVVASVPGMTSTALSVALRTSHATMPNIILDDRELQDLSAYILGLKGGP